MPIETISAHEIRMRAASVAGSRLKTELEGFQELLWNESFIGAPTLHLDDVSGIPFLEDIPGVEQYQHRARVRAGDGDLFAATTEPAADYEHYCREQLGLGSARALVAPSDAKLEVARACMTGPAFEAIVRHAKAAGSLAVHPYMGIESVWQLAEAVSAESTCPIGVLAPPPPVTWIANDKRSLSTLVDRLLGPDFLVDTRSSDSPAELTEHLHALSKVHDRVALKRLRCASAMGNQVFDSRSIQELQGPGALQERVRSFLARTQWDGTEEVLAVAWEDAVSSPSTQLWIPRHEQGTPSLDGIYEQLLHGDTGVFVGSKPSCLAGQVEHALARASLIVAQALQQFGYHGRCSFDFLVVGEPDGEFAQDFWIRFVECNGRWGGTSTPMSLLDRLLATPRTPGAIPSRPSYRAQDFVHEELVGARFGEVLAAVGEDLFDPATGRGRFVFYNVGPLQESGKLDVIALGESPERAQEAVEEELPRMLGLS